MTRLEPGQGLVMPHWAFAPLHNSSFFESVQLPMAEFAPMDEIDANACQCRLDDIQQCREGPRELQPPAARNRQIRFEAYCTTSRITLLRT